MSLCMHNPQQDPRSTLNTQTPPGPPPLSRADPADPAARALAALVAALLRDARSSRQALQASRSTISAACGSKAQRALPSVCMPVSRAVHVVPPRQRHGAAAAVAGCARPLPGTGAALT